MLYESLHTMTKALQTRQAPNQQDKVEGAKYITKEIIRLFLELLQHVLGTLLL